MKLAPLILCVAPPPIGATAQILELAQLNTEQITSLDRAQTIVVIHPGRATIASASRRARRVLL
jgi:hypothetical protein